MKNCNQKFRTLEHLADLKVQVFGGNKEVLFENAILALGENLKPDLQDSAALIQKQVRIVSPDLPSLLVDFLNEVLYLSQTEKAAFDKIKISKLTDTEIIGELSGKKAERFSEDIKAATYHNLEVHQNQDGVWEAIILFDV